MAKKKDALDIAAQQRAKEAANPLCIRLPQGNLYWMVK